MAGKKLILDIVKYILFFGAGIGIFIWVYRRQDMDSIWKGLSEFKYGWIIASLGVSVLSNLLRSMRWKMLIESIGFKPRLSNTFLSVLVMYLANYALPRLGEVTRCGVLKKYEGIPFTSQLGTVLMERIVDVIALLVMLAAVLLVDWNTLTSFGKLGQVGSESNGYSFLSSTWFFLLVGLLIALIVVAWLTRRSWSQTRPVLKIRSFLGKFLEGLKSVLRLKSPWLFILLTIGIYGSYYLMTWFVMLGFGPTQGLSPFIALAVLAFGSVGMALPVQGGLGTYHAFVVATLLLYGIAESDGMLLALVLHGSTTIFVIFIGILALVFLPLVNRQHPPGVSLVDREG